METTELRITGMTCNSCVASVIKALKHVPGVQDVQVDLLSGTARVTGDHTLQQVPALLTALAAAGYSAAGSETPGSVGADGLPTSYHSSATSGAAKGHGGCCCH